MYIHGLRYISAVTNATIACEIKHTEEYLIISFNGKFIGTLTPQPSAEFGYVTENEFLKPELKSLSIAIKEDSAITMLPVQLKKIFGKDIVDWDFDEGDNIHINLSDEVNLERFESEIRKKISTLVSFSKPLIVFLKQSRITYVKQIHVN